MLSLVKMGFKRKEAEAALSSSPSGEVMGHDTLIRLLEPLRPPTSSSSPAPPPSRGDPGEGSSSTRTEEVRMMGSIYCVFLGEYSEVQQFFLEVL